MSWSLNRIDDRLIHGQVLVAWGARYAPKRILLADDAVAASDWERKLYEDAAPGVIVRVLGVADAAREYVAELDKPGAAFLLVRDLATALALVEAGAPIRRFNVGGLHYAPGRTKVHESVYLDDADRTAARALLGRGVALEVQDVPASRPQALDALDPAVRP